MERLTLPDAAWRTRPGLPELCDVLGAGAGETRYVGGAVRDTLLGIDVSDVDLATRHAPEDVIDLLARARIKAVPTGLAHGTITAVLADGAPIEVTTLRRDTATDGRHATVAFTDDWREDAARRDFTINALYADPATGEIFEYFGGLDDLAARRVRFIGDPLQRIAEDHLRILRFFRFHARFGDEPNAAALDACTQRANDLMALSRERISAEFLKLLVAHNAVATLTLMIERGILRPVLPEIDEAGVARLAHVAAVEAQAELAPDPLRRLAAVLPRDPALGENVGARLKLSNAQRKRIVSALTDPTGSPHPLAYRLGRDGALDRWLLTVEEPFDAVIGARDILAWPIPSFPLTGGALVQRGVGKGPDVARLLKQVEDQWVSENFPDADRVGEIADAAVAQWRSSTSIA
ncbi:CCA tRNA nucleotidyltransferase [Sphingomonas glacialis]|uniref:CCA tRNA nucleotidyltransferase n=1 Tax=Sphingomonas glacialis TaxID=658225 RepID=A0A502G044_9SPHN|nr:CCA tRNA nucleotidyltransferase [Sphingomonas glacialis]TPG54912.1 CCA tRNA nucleotidyltransferase [Sphingomonas glacialis]